MPSIHIPEDVFAEYVDSEGSYKEAKDAIKTVVENNAGN